MARMLNTSPEMPRMASEVARAKDDGGRNRILAALPERDRQRLVPYLRHISYDVKQVLQRAGEPLRFVHFPTGGVFSITAVLPDGALVESATVGDEGFLGVELFLMREAVGVGETMLQVPEGTALRLEADVFRDELERGGCLADLIGRYTHLLLVQMMYATACNAHHPVLDRCAKWLLLTQDRMHTDEFRLSHEVLSMMLGVTRPTVTAVAGSLQSAGLIGHTYGRVRVLDRAGLERAACSCYATARTQFETVR